MEPIETTDLIQLLSIEQWEHEFQNGNKLPPELEELRKVVREHPELLESLQQQSDWDRGIAAVFDDVELPSGLSQRLIDSLSNHVPEALVSVAEDELVSPRMDVAVDPDGASWMKPRRLWLSAVGLSVCAILVLMWSPFSEPPSGQHYLAYTDLQQMIPAWLEELESSGEWDLAMDGSPYPRELVESQVHGQVKGWRVLKEHSGCVAMNLSSTDHGRLWVLILKSEQTASPGGYSELKLSGDFAAGSWSDGEHLFIAISDESSKQIDQIFKGKRPI